LGVRSGAGVRLGGEHVGLAGVRLGGEHVGVVLECGLAVSTWGAGLDDVW
jgi:hypothetical protein